MTDHTLIKNNPFGFKVAIRGCEAELYHDKRYDDILGAENTGVSCHCVVCSKMPQTVCKECVEYVCEDHLYRHPNCDEGR